jgi:hypothetical protein
MARITDERNWLKTPLTVTCTIVTGRHLHLVRQLLRVKNPHQKVMQDRNRLVRFYL